MRVKESAGQRLRLRRILTDTAATAKGPGAAIRVDSAIEEFVAIARAAADAARANGLEVSEATRVNLAHLGIAIDA